MKRVITVSLCLFAIMAFSSISFAQEFSISENVVQPFGQIQYESPDAVTITHSATQNIVSLNSVSCNAGGLHTDNAYLRSFILGDFGITNDWDVSTVEIGVETCTGAGGTQPIECRLYISPSPFPVTYAVLGPPLATVATTITDQAGTIFAFDFSGVPSVIPAGSELVVEIFTPDGQTLGNSFFIGSNPDGQTAPSYIAAADCGIIDPTDLAAIGFPGMHIVMNVTGDDASGGACNLFFDDFEAGTGQWTIAGGSGAPCDWAIYAPPYPNSYTLPCDPTCNAILGADSDECGTGFTSTATTGAIDATGMVSVVLTFDNDWNAINAADEAYVQVSTDGGATWSVVVSWLGVDQRNTVEVHDISGMVAGTNFMLQFLSIQPGFDWWWVIDNVCIDGIVPVELTSFTASVIGNDVTLDWVTATETNNQGFEVERNSGTGYVNIGYVAGFGTSTETHSYSFVDASLSEGTHSYRLKQLDLDGTFYYYDAINVDITIPDVFALEQNYPNPFNPSTKINFSLAVDSKVSLKVFDILGQEVANLVNTDLAAGSHNVDFNASLLNSGVYFYKIEATGIDGTNFTNVKKMILTK